MTYLGVAIRNEHNHIFMQSLNDVIFTSTHALFDEAIFPHCKIQSKKHNTQIWQDTTPSDPTGLLLDMSDDDDPLLEQSFKAPASAVKCLETLEQPDAPPPVPWIPQCTPKQPPQALPAAPCCSEHEKKVPLKPDNVAWSVQRGLLLLDRQQLGDTYEETNIQHAIILRLDRGEQWAKRKCFLGIDLRGGSRNWDLTLCLYCIDQEWEIQVVKGYFIYYGPVCMDQGTMARKRNRGKLIEHCGNGKHWLVWENWWRRG